MDDHIGNGYGMMICVRVSGDVSILKEFFDGVNTDAISSRG